MEYEISHGRCMHACIPTQTKFEHHFSVDENSDTVCSPVQISISSPSVDHMDHSQTCVY